MNITKIKINDSENGPKINVLVLGGVHGNELTPIAALKYLESKIGEINNDLIGQVIIANNINKNGIKKNSRFVENENTSDLNRSFKHNQSISDYVDTLRKHIKESHVVIDVHSSPKISEFVLIDIDEYCECVTDWCHDVPKVYRYSSGDTIKRYALTNGSFGKGALATTLELNKLDVFDDASAIRGADIMIKLINNVKHFYTSDLVSEDFIIPNELYEQKTHLSGFVDIKKDIHDVVTKGDVIAEILNDDLTTFAFLRANASGTIISSPTIGYVNRGDIVFLIQPKN